MPEVILQAKLCLTQEEKKAKRLAYARAWYHLHREERLVSMRIYTQEHAPENRARQRLYDAEHKEERALYDAQRYLSIREASLATSQDYYQEHRDLLLERHKQWAKDHPESMKESASRRRACKAGAPINDFTLVQWEEIKIAYGHRCVYCKRKMQRLTRDHITPLSDGGSHTFSNIVPACRSCNSKKHTGPVLCPVQPLLLTVASAKNLLPERSISRAWGAPSAPRAMTRMAR